MAALLLLRTHYVIHESREREVMLDEIVSDQRRSVHGDSTYYLPSFSRRLEKMKNTVIYEGKKSLKC
jgi:hypothetical protein